MSKKMLKMVTKKFKAHLIDSHNQHGDETVIITPEALRNLTTALRDEPDFACEILADITVVDYLGHKTPRFEVVYHFLSLKHRHRLRVKVPLTEEACAVDSVADIYPSANWAEREAFDMYGVVFKAHPDLRRILMYEEFQGHPLRKDYPLMGSQPRIPLLEPERPDTPVYPPNFGDYGPAKENV